MVRILWWAVGDLLSPINQWFFMHFARNPAPAEAMGIAFQFLEENHKPGLFCPWLRETQAAVQHRGQEDLACRCHIRHLSITKCPSPWGSKGMLCSGIALPCQKLDFLWRSEGPIPPACHSEALELPGNPLKGSPWLLLVLSKWEQRHNPWRGSSLMIISRNIRS